MILPNQLTTLRIILTPVFLYLFLQDDPIYIQISFVVFIIAAITDWYDGWLARKFNYITDWGKFMDPLADKILTSTAFFALASLGIIELWMVFIIVIRDLIITVLRIIADLKKRKFKTSRSAQVKTFAQMIFLYYLLLIYVLQTFEFSRTEYFETFDSLSNPTMIYYVMFGITLFTFYTGIEYLYSNRKLLKRLFKNEK